MAPDAKQMTRRFKDGVSLATKFVLRPHRASKRLQPWINEEMCHGAEGGGIWHDAQSIRYNFSGGVI